MSLDYPDREIIEEWYKNHSKALAAQKAIDLLLPKVTKDLNEGRVQDGAFLQLILALRKKKKTETIKSLVNQAYKIKPESITVAREKINLLQANQDYEGCHKAIDILAEKREVKDSLVILARAQLYTEQGAVQDSLDYLENIITVYSDLDAQVYRSASILWRAYEGNLEKGLEYARTAYVLSPHDETIAANYAICLMDYADKIVVNEVDQAKEFRQEALVILQGLSAEAQNINQRRIDFLSASLKENFSVFKAFQSPERIISNRGSVDTSIAKNNTIEQASKLAKDQGSLAALKYLLNALKQPYLKVPSIYNQAASYALHIGWFEVANKLLEKTLEFDPRNSNALHLKMISLSRTEGREGEAYDLARKLHKLLPENIDVATFYAMGLAMQFKFEEMMGVINPFLKRMQTGDLQKGGGSHIAALYFASMPESQGKQAIDDFAEDEKFRNTLGRLSEEFRREVMLNESSGQQQLSAQEIAWELRYANCLKKSVFWQFAQEGLMPANSLAVRVGFKSQTMDR